MDDVDRAYIESLIPSDVLVTNLITIIGWFDPDTGDQRWKLYVDSDQNTAVNVGLLELAKDQLMVQARRVQDD